MLYFIIVLVVHVPHIVAVEAGNYDMNFWGVCVLGGGHLDI